MNVIIRDDNLAEGPEEIRVTLTTTDPEVRLNITEAIIEIIDTTDGGSISVLYLPYNTITYVIS